MPRKNILVVDDEKAQREILEMILSEEGYDVTTAASGEAALKFAKDATRDYWIGSAWIAATCPPLVG